MVNTSIIFSNIVRILIYLGANKLSGHYYWTDKINQTCVKEKLDYFGKKKTCDSLTTNSREGN